MARTALVVVLVLVIVKQDHRGLLVMMKGLQGGQSWKVLSEETVWVSQAAVGYPVLSPSYPIL